MFFFELSKKVLYHTILFTQLSRDGKMSFNEKEIVRNPIFFERNRIYRVYRGGEMFHQLFGDTPENSLYPEEWIASAVKALGTPHDDIPDYGISKVKDTEVPFSELLRGYPRELLGPGKEFNIFAKVLHSAVRLPVQAHPDEEFSQNYFSDDKGKEEAWLFLAVEENAEIYFGFREGVGRKEFTEAVDKSEHDKDVMATLLNRVKISKGDIFFVPGKVAHTIGKGCMVLEIEQSTDYMLLAEHWCDEVHLTESQMFMGLEKDQAVECFDFERGAGKGIIDQCRMNAEVFMNKNGVIGKTLITEKETPNFSMNLYTLGRGSFSFPRGPSIIIPISGRGMLKGPDTERNISKGEYFFLPYSASGSEISTEGTIDFVECLPAGGSYSMRSFSGGFS